MRLYVVITAHYPSTMSETDSESLSDLQQPGQQQDEDWEDWDNEEDEEQTQSLFSSTILPSPELALEYDAQHFSFDLRQYMIQVRHPTAAYRSSSHANRLTVCVLAVAPPVRV
jgi:hypothetical protein